MSASQHKGNPGFYDVRYGLNSYTPLIARIIPSITPFAGVQTLAHVIEFSRIAWNRLAKQNLGIRNAATNSALASFGVKSTSLVNHVNVTSATMQEGSTAPKIVSSMESNLIFKTVGRKHRLRKLVRTMQKSQASLSGRQDTELGRRYCAESAARNAVLV